MPATRSSALRRASAVLALVLLSGCTSEAAPAPTAATPGASTSATPRSAAPTEPTIEKITTPPAVPIDLKTPGRVGSKAAVTYFVALYGYTLNTGDTSLLRGISASTCEYCRDLFESIESTRQSGWDVVGSALTLKTAKLYEEESSQDRHVWLMDVDIAPTLETSPDGERSERARELHTTALIAVWTGRSWKIEDKRAVEEKETPSR